MSELANQPESNAAAMLALVERGEIVTALGRAQLWEIERRLEKAVAEAEAAGELVKVACGPERHGLPAHLVTMIGMGTGYLRHGRDVIRALRKVKGKRKGRPGAR